MVDQSFERGLSQAPKDMVKVGDAFLLVEAG